MLIRPKDIKFETFNSNSVVNDPYDKNEDKVKINTMDELFIRTNAQIEEMSDKTVEQLKMSLTELEKDSRLSFQKDKLTKKLNETCVALCTKANLLDKFEPAVVKSMYCQLCMVVKARSLLIKYINVKIANRLLSKCDQDANRKLNVQCEINAIISKKLDKLVDELMQQPSADVDFDEGKMPEYGKYCYYLAGLDESTFFKIRKDNKKEVWKIHHIYTFFWFLTLNS